MWAGQRICSLPCCPSVWTHALTCEPAYARSALSHAPHQLTSYQDLTHDAYGPTRPYTIFRPDTLPAPALEAPPLEPLPLPEGAPPDELVGDLTGTPSTVVPGTGGGFTDRPTGLTTTAGFPTVCTTGATAMRAGVMSTPWGLHEHPVACQPTSAMSAQFLSTANLLIHV